MAIALQQTGLLQPLERATLDQFFRLRAAVSPTGAADPAPPITLVTVTEADLKQLDQWPLNDAQLSQLLRRLDQAQPAVIGLNLYRDLPVAPGQEELRQTFATLPKLIGVEKAVADGQGDEIGAPEMLQSLGQVAASDLLPDPDGKLRRHLLALSNAQGEFRLGLGARLAVEYLAQQGLQHQIVDVPKPQIYLGQARIAPLAPSDGGYLRADVGGYQILSNFYPSPAVFDRVSLSAVLMGQVPEALLRDRIVIIGVTASSLQTRFFAAGTTKPDQGWYGVELQADLASQLIAAAQGDRPLLRGVAAPLGWLWTILWAGGGGLVTACLPQRRISLVALPLGAGLLWGLSYGLFLQGWWIVVAAPGLAMVAAGAVSCWLMLDQQMARSRQLLITYEQSLERKIAASTQQLQEKNRLLSQAQRAAEQANQAKSEFLARITHELRTPLNAMLGFSRMMVSDGSLPQDSQDSLDIINSSSEHLLALVNEVLDISKIEAKQLTLKEQIVDFPGLLQDLEHLFGLQASDKSLTLRCSTDARLPRHIWADETKLRQILINLLGNAIKFTQSGHVILRSWCTPDASDRLYIEVEDTGPGMSPSELEQIFTPYMQGLAASPKLGGTGLGLSISKDLAQLMGGEILVSSQLGQGSRFQLVVPLRAAELQPSVIADPMAAELLPESLRGKRILVVDDVTFNRKLLAKLLLEQGLEVKEAESGTAAIALWQHWQPHLILMDLLMPELDGYGTTRYIRQQEAAAQFQWPTPIIATSAGLTSPEQAAAFEAGCNGVLQKPFQRHQVVMAIAEALVLS